MKWLNPMYVYLTSKFVNFALPESPEVKKRDVDNSCNARLLLAIIAIAWWAQQAWPIMCSYWMLINSMVYIYSGLVIINKFTVTKPKKKNTAYICFYELLPNIHQRAAKDLFYISKPAWLMLPWKQIVSRINICRQQQYNSITAHVLLEAKSQYFERTWGASCGLSPRNIFFFLILLHCVRLVQPHETFSWALPFCSLTLVCAVAQNPLPMDVSTWRSKVKAL